LSKKLATSLVLFLISIAILSNRFFVLRQFTVRLNQNVTFHLPIESSGPAQAGKTTLGVALTNEGVSELQPPPRDAVEIKTGSRDELRGSRIVANFPTDFSSRPPAYILQSVLNL
jgi:hypothetical protein